MEPTPTTIEKRNESPAKPRSSRKRRLDERGWMIVFLLITLPVLLAGYRASSLPGADRLEALLSLQDLPHEMHARVLHLLAAPMGALIVVFVRLTLGLRVLGPFRSVLLAVAFQVTGMGVGLAFFALVLAAVVLLRPVYKRMRLPYFGRSAAMLASVATIITTTMMLGMALGLPNVERVAYFPVVVLTLSGDAFAGALRKEGVRPALWRAGSTAATAVAITALAATSLVKTALLEHVELQFLIIAGIILTCELLNFKLLHAWNPKPPKRPGKSQKKSVT